MDFLDKSGRYSREISPFWDILPNEFVGVLYQAFLPGAIRIGKIYDYAIETFGYQLMGREFAAIIRGDGQNSGQPVRIQQSDYGFGNRPGILSMRQFLDYAVRGVSFSENQNGPVAALAYDEIHLPVAETRAVGFLGPVMDACAVWYICSPGGFAFLFRLAVILTFVSGIGKQLAAPVCVDVVVDGLSGNVCSFFGQSADNLRRRPLLILNPLLYAP